MSNTHLTRQFGSRALGLLLPILMSCATGGGVLTGMSDWSTLSSGKGTVTTHVVNESGEAITVRIQDDTDKVIAQAPLAAHETETLNLPVGSVHATVRVMRDGHASYSDPQALQVSTDHNPAEWRFSAPSIE